MQLPTAGSMTVQELRGLQSKQRTLRSELQDAASRRQTVSGQLRSTDSNARPGLEQRLLELDSRILSLEKQITENGALITNAPLALQAEASTMVAPGNINPELLANRIAGDLVPIVAILSVFVFGPIGLAISRLIWKRASNAPRPVADTATQQRLENLQQAVDTIAIEVERISEGQRFVTKLFSEKDRAVLGAGAGGPGRMSN
ncbi:MAG: hypothetical protein WD801_12495 [Gemmatimonadaceae bacterium]